MKNHVFNEIAATESRLEITPQAVTAQYRKAIAGCLEMVRFGAMLLEVSSNLTREIGARGGGHTPREETLKGWLEEHCPEVNYGTAMRFKALAECVQRQCNLPPGVPMRLALPGPGGDIEVDTEWERQGRGRPVTHERLLEMRRDVWELVEGKSARQLMFSFMAPGPQGGARPRPAALPKPTQAHDDQVAIWTEHIRALADSVRHKEHMLFSSAELRGFSDELQALRDALREAQGRG